MVYFVKINQVPSTSSILGYWKSSNTKACAKKLSQILVNNIDNGGRGIGLRIYVRYCRSKKSSAPSIWLDIANVYGSILHELIFFTLRRYGIPNKWIQIVESYYVWIFSKSFSKSTTSSWHRHERGIFAGCTISIILFLAGINVILEYSLPTNVRKCVINNNQLPLICTFMDNLNLLCSSVSGAKTLLHRCTKALKWAGLDFQARKSTSIIIIKGRSMDTIPCSVSERNFSSYIPFIHSRPIKFLGHIKDSSISAYSSLLLA